MILISARARDEIERAAQWWLEHREKAPEAFEDDLAKAFDLGDRLLDRVFLFWRQFEKIAVIVSYNELNDCAVRVRLTFDLDSSIDELSAHVPMVLPPSPAPAP